MGGRARGQGGGLRITMRHHQRFSVLCASRPHQDSSRAKTFNGKVGAQSLSRCHTRRQRDLYVRKHQLGAEPGLHSSLLAILLLRGDCVGYHNAN